MTNDAPIHELHSNLKSARLRAIEELAASSASPSVGDLQKLAVLQTALKGVEDEIKAHRVKLGGGGEMPLK